MESYIIRIYRFEHHHNIAGTVQHIEEADKLTFSSIDELWEILLGKHTEKTRPYTVNLRNEPVKLT